MSRGITALHLVQSGITLLSEQLPANLVSGATFIRIRSNINLSRFCYICPHTAMCPHTAVYVSSSCYICVLYYWSNINPVHLVSGATSTSPYIWSSLVSGIWSNLVSRISYLEHPILSNRYLESYRQLVKHGATGTAAGSTGFWSNRYLESCRQLVKHGATGTTAGSTGFWSNRYMESCRQPRIWSSRASSCASIRQHTSAYVSIRQHTSAYVSIRQHTSAYVSSGAVGHLAAEKS